MNNNNVNRVLRPFEKLSNSRLAIFLIFIIDVTLAMWIIFFPQLKPVTSNVNSGNDTVQLSNGCTVAPKDLNGQKLIFDDEFGCDTTLNPGVWQSDWFGEDGEMNNVHTYSSNVSLSGGWLNLALTSSTSGSLVTTAPNGPTDPGFKFTFGTIVWRAKIPYVGNHVVNWPALWMAGVPNNPTGGEIDVAEGLSGSMCSLVHNLQGAFTGSCRLGIYPGWHTYAMTWATDKVVFTFDNKVVDTVTQYVTSLPMYIVMNNGWAGGNTPTSLPSTINIQYVRVYQ